MLIYRGGKTVPRVFADLAFLGPFESINGFPREFLLLCLIIQHISTDKSADADECTMPKIFVRPTFLFTQHFFHRRKKHKTKFRVLSTKILSDKVFWSIITSLGSQTSIVFYISHLSYSSTRENPQVARDS